MKISQHIFGYITLLIVIIILIILLFTKKNNSIHYVEIPKQIKREVIEIRQPVRDLYRERITDVLEPPEQTHTEGIPINIHTRGEVKDYQQIGVLINVNEGKKEDIIPLFGKPTYPGSRLWYYYTRTNSYNPVKLAIMKDKKDCQNEYGCELLNDNETVKTVANDDEYKIKLYHYDKPKYIPYVY